MWIDAVGGYLVCLSHEVTIGQAVPMSGVDLPILGDLSRRHALIRRESDQYVIQPHASVAIAGEAIEQSTLLSDGDRIDLGSCVQMLFRLPHPLSSTARLEVVSNHRTQPVTDSILLMSNSCVLGPSNQNHVVCRQWEQDVVLYRHGNEYRCRSDRSIEIDGKVCEKQGSFQMGSCIRGLDFCLSLEAI